MANRDLYASLGLSKGASDADIKKAYKKLARELHPDRNPGNAAAEERFKQLSYAYQVLSDAKKRELYDEFGEVGLKEGFDPEAYRQYQRWQQQAARGGGPQGGFAFNLEDLFGQRGAGGGGGGPGGPSGFAFDVDDLMGGGLGDILRGRAERRRPGAQRGGDLQSEVTIDFAEALRGTEKELAFQLPAVANGHRSIRVRIPAGVQDGGKVRLKGQGAPGAGGGPAGDLVLIVHVRPHPFFWREGDDLHMNLPVTPLEAFRGAKVQVPTPSGPVAVGVPKGTQSGAKLRLRGKGAPKRGGGHGDLYAHVMVRLPERADGEVERALEQLEPMFGGDVRANLRF